MPFPPQGPYGWCGASPTLRSQANEDLVATRRCGIFAILSMRTPSPALRRNTLRLRPEKSWRKYFSESMTGDEAQILFWYVRNRLYFDQELEAHERVLVCCYEDFVADPDKIMRTVYEFIGRAFPGSKMTAGVHRNSVDRRVRLEANPELVALCKQLHEALKAVACQ